MRPFILPLDPHFSIFSMKISKTSPQLHFGLTKKDPGLVFHFDVLDLFKSCSKLGLTRIQISKTKFKKIKKQKTMCSFKHHPTDLNIMSNIVLTSSDRNTTLFIMFHNYSHIAFGLVSVPWASCHHFAPRAPCAHYFFSSPLGCRYLVRLLQTYHRAVQNIKGNEIMSSDP